MIEFSLTLRWTEASRHSTAAWFIPGADARVWLDELARWEIPLSGVRMFSVPASIRDRKIIGVLVETGSAKPVAVLRGQPYGRVANRLYLPVDSNLYPPMTDAELNEALPMAAYAFHPVAGLVGFTADEALDVDGLLKLPQSIKRDWSRARRARSLSDRLLSVSATPMPDVEELLQAHRGDIGSEAADDLPPSADESIAKKAGTALLLPPLGLIALLGMPPAMFAEWIGRARKELKTSQPHKSGTQPKAGAPAGVQKAKPKTNWMSGFQQWTAAAYSVLSKSLLDARSRELRRLQELLRNNPDEGLRYAIPLDGQGSRGVARPGWRLAPRDLSFNFARMLSGGRAADPWAIADDTRQALLRQYREAANRELALGRFDRAAYIFANLLGDFGSAANAMEQGKRYREAAVIYREKLKNSRKAAECLEHGGLLQEAAELYVHEVDGMYEKAGDLYQIIGQSDQAMRCYGIQVSRLFDQGKILAAAALLENKLHNPDVALELLAEAWPRNDSNGLCLRESFALRGRLARHEDAVHRIKSLRDSQSAVSHPATLASVLAVVSLSYPQLEVRARSADAARVVAGRQLMKDHVEDRAAIARAVAKLAPGDRLLKRDVRRYVDEPRKRPAPAQRSTGDSPRVIRQFELARDISWHTASASDEFFFALGNQKGRVYVVYGTWDGRHIGAFFETPDDLKLGEAYRLHPEPGRRRVVITPLIHETLAILMPSDRFGHAMEFGSPPWLRSHAVRAIAHSGATTWVLHYDPVLSAHDSDTGRLLGTEGIHQAFPDHPIQMVARTEHLLMTWGSGFCRRGPISGIRLESLPSRAMQVEVTAPGQQYRAAIAMEEGIEICFENSHLHSAFALVEPQIAFSRGGHLIAADRTSGQVFHFEDEKLSRVVRFDVNGEQSIALTPTSHLDEFARFTSDGKVTIYKIPR